MVIVTAPCSFNAKKQVIEKNWRMDRMEYNTLWLFTGWWFGTFFIFPYIGNNHPN